MSQSELARRAGTTQGRISRLERGEQSPTVATLNELLLAMGEEIDAQARPLERDHDRSLLEAVAALSPAERIRYGLNASRTFDRLRRAPLARSG